MNEERSRGDNVESLIGNYLRIQEETVDASKILAGVRSKALARPIANPRFVVRAIARWSAVAAALVLMLGFGWTFRQASVQADAVKLVREARDSLGSTPDDRTYRIAIDLAPGAAERSPFLAAIASLECRLWTRQDRLWVEWRSASESWAYGRDQDRHVWVAASPNVGLDFGPEEVPDQLSEALDLLSFDLKTMLDWLATDFNVTMLSDVEDRKAGITRIQGMPRPGHPRSHVRSLTVEIDDATKIVRKVLVSRIREGAPVAEVSYTFDRAETQPDSTYQLATHLEPGAIVFGQDRRLRRRRELVRFFGSILLKNEGTIR